MIRPFRLAVIVAVLAAVSTPAQQPAQEPAAAQEPTQPRFRGGANLVRVDAYVTADGQTVTDLSAADFEILEDNVPQRVESFERIVPRGPGPQAERREPNSVAESRAMSADPEARVFVLFMDIWHVQIEGSFHAQGPIVRLLNRVIGQDDLVGVMTPEMSARNLTLARRLATLEGILQDNWFWGQRNRLTTLDPREETLRFCYPDVAETEDIAEALIARRRVGKTLDAIEDLVLHLEGIREERKFVLLLTEGWLLPRADQALARPIRQPGTFGEPRAPGGPVPIGVDPAGRVRLDNDKTGVSWESCERERSMLAFADYEQEFTFLLRRANRANVSFYPIDARGLVVFDEPIGPEKPPPPSVDAALMRERRNAMHDLAVQTDGYAVVDVTNLDRALERIVEDTASYYLLGYYSTNTRLDGRYRRLTVRVKRPGLDVRARPGYLAPTEAELASSRVNALMNGAPPGHTTIPPGVSRALERLAPARGNVPVRVQATAAPSEIWVTAELDPATVKSIEWQQGGRARLVFEHERGAAAPAEVDVSIAPGQRAFNASPPAGVTLAAGRYVVRLHLTPAGGTIPLLTTLDVVVPDSADLLSATGAAWRRGPSTGLSYEPTADARFRRTERLRVEVPRVRGAGTPSARLIGRDGQPLALHVALSERVDADSGVTFVVADLTLAPLAQGEYVLEIGMTDGDKTDSANYGFRIVP